MNDLVQLREYAKKEAERFRADLLARLGLVLESHTDTLVAFVVDMQGRLDAVEEQLAWVAVAQVVHRTGDGQVVISVGEETLDSIKALVASAKARTK